MKSFFVLVAVVVCLLLAPAAARAQSPNPTDDPPRYEVGVHFSSLTLTPADFHRTEAGFGGRFTVNLNEHVALEAETTFFPNSGFSGEPRASGNAVQGLFGAKAGKRCRTAIPIATGASTRNDTCTSLAVCNPTVAPSPAKYATDSVTTTGSVTTASTELTAVTVMFRATSAPARWLNTVAITPPGAAARTIIPIARSGWSPGSRT